MKKILYGIIAIIVVAGLVMGLTQGFNFGLTYSKHEIIQANLNQKVNKDDIEKTVNEAFENTNVRVQTVELFEDAIAISVNTIADEQLDKLASALNEKYSLELEKADFERITIPASNIKDIVYKYILPAIIVVLIVAVYMMIRYKKLTSWKIGLTLILSIVLVEALIASAYTIFRIPVNELTMPIALLAAGLTLLCLSINFENKLEKVRESEDIIE